MKPNRNSSRTSRWVAACVAAGLLIASCGSDDPDATSDVTADAGTSAVEATAAPEPDVTDAPDTTSAAPDATSGSSGDPCADREALRSSIGALADVDIVAEGTNGIETAIDDIREDLRAVRESAGDDIRPEVDAVESAVDDVEAAVSDGPADDVAGTVDALSTLGSAAADLLEALDAGACPSEEPTTT